MIDSCVNLGYLFMMPACLYVSCYYILTWFIWYFHSLCIWCFAWLTCYLLTHGMSFWYMMSLYDIYIFEWLCLFRSFIRSMLRMVYIIHAPKCYHLNMGCINFSSCFFVTLFVHYMCTYNLSKYFWYDKHLEVVLSYKLIT